MDFLNKPVADSAFEKSLLLKVAAILLVFTCSHSKTEVTEQSQPTFTCSKLTIEILKKGVKYVKS